MSTHSLLAFLNPIHTLANSLFIKLSSATPACIYCLFPLWRAVGQGTPIDPKDKFCKEMNLVSVWLHLVISGVGQGKVIDLTSPLTY